MGYRAPTETVKPSPRPPPSAASLGSREPMRLLPQLLSACLLFLGSLAGAAPAGLPNGMETSDVKASKVLPLSQGAVFNHLLDLRNHQALWSPDCLIKWVHGSVNVGQGANAEVVYVPGLMRRKLAMTLSRAKGNRLIDIEHAGNKGFTTRWTLEPEGEGVRVDVHTYINPPPRPFDRVYFTNVRPKWQVCHDQALVTLEQRLSK